VKERLLQGHDKLACRAIVMRQYRTALNHLLQIKGAKKELCKVLKKNINQEVQKLCSNVFLEICIQTIGK
jgi:hypothetical protein